MEGWSKLADISVEKLRHDCVGIFKLPLWAFSVIFARKHISHRASKRDLSNFTSIETLKKILS